MYTNNKDMYTQSAKVMVGPTFFGKVMAFFALAIFASAGGVYIGTQYLLEFFFTNTYMMYVLFGVELAIIFTSRKWSTKSPLNKILFAAFALITGLTIAPLIGVIAATPGGLPMLVKALVITGLMFGATAIFGMTTRFNLSGLRGFLLMGLIGMIVVGVVGIFVPWSNNFEILFSGLGVALFSAFTMYHFQKIQKYPEDRYIDAALALYLDIFNLFLYVLRFIMAMSRD